MSPSPKQTKFSNAQSFLANFWRQVFGLYRLVFWKISISGCQNLAARFLSMNFKARDGAYLDTVGRSIELSKLDLKSGDKVDSY